MLGRLKPIFSIRANKVVGLTPKSSAAPPAPLIFQRLPFRCAPATRTGRLRQDRFEPRMDTNKKGEIAMPNWTIFAFGFDLPSGGTVAAGCDRDRNWLSN
jgi:hypothetical protein